MTPSPGKKTGPDPTRGERFARGVRESFELNLSEDALVDEIHRSLDILDRLPASEVMEIRLQQVTLCRLVSALALPEPASAARTSVDTQRARKAARSRWGEPRA
jgi:hypothetical protein